MGRRGLRREGEGLRGAAGMIYILWLASIWAAFILGSVAGRRCK